MWLGRKRKALAGGDEIFRNGSKPKIRKKDVIQKMKQMVWKENPESRRNVKKKLGIGLATIHKIIHEYLN